MRSILTGPVANFPVADSFNRAAGARLFDRRHPAPVRGVSGLGRAAGRAGAAARGILGALRQRLEDRGVLTLQSGIPIAVTQATNFNAFAGFGTQRPNRVGDPDLPRRADDRALVQHRGVRDRAAVHDRNSSRNPVRGPGYRTSIWR